MRYYVYDVFTDTPFGGNQLAIVPDADGLSPSQMQQIAREFNFSETSFILTPQDPAHTAQVRYFTPMRELPFAGHPTIGTAIMLADLGNDENMVLELGVGPLSCTAANGFSSFTTDHPLEIKGQPEVDLVARAIGCAPDQIIGQPQIASLGGDFVLVELNDRDTLSSLTPNIDAMREGTALFPGNHDFAVYPYVSHGDIVHARMFAPLDGIAEDPATGSAAAPLAAFLQKTADGPIKINIHQGDDMGRPSRISLRADKNSVTVSGNAIKIMQGEIFL
jgi:trans-2,3-dihydro-3-hydroxyanthranilate isomerase